jgi:hypothetical protein
MRDRRKEQVGRHRSRWKDNTKMNLREILWRGMAQINLAKDRDQL